MVHNGTQLAGSGQEIFDHDLAVQFSTSWTFVLPGFSCDGKGMPSLPLQTCAEKLTTEESGVTKCP